MTSPHGRPDSSVPSSYVVRVLRATTLRGFVRAIDPSGLGTYDATTGKVMSGSADPITNESVGQYISLMLQEGSGERYPVEPNGLLSLLFFADSAAYTILIVLTEDNHASIALIDGHVLSRLEAVTRFTKAAVEVGHLPFEVVGLT
jgi:hypothetical protein